MATYIMLFRYTQQGIGNIKESPARIEAGRKIFRELGAELKDWYLTSGAYDGIIIVEAPDHETVARAALALGSLGNIKTETMRAFTENEFRGMVESLP